MTPDQARSWARYADTSPLYQHLIEVVAADADLMMALNAVVASPRPNIFFAGVQYIMMRDGGDDLEAFYPGFSDDPRDSAAIDEPFRRFVLDHLGELTEIGRSRHTQTNECRRCVALLPAIWATGVDRFHLVDIGTSAGLNLQLAGYHYSWAGLEWGMDSPVRLVTESRGERVSPRPIEVMSRTGIDLDPIDPADPDARRWLEALIWPEHGDRRARLRSALDLAQHDPPRLVAGDVLTILGPVIDGLPGDEPVVVMNSFILNQFAPADRERVGDIVAESRARRPVLRVSMEWLDANEDAAALSIDTGAGLEKIGDAQPHGEWIELYARP